jgi:hypothetical protein
MGNLRIGLSPIAVIIITEGRAKKSRLKSIAKELTRRLLNAPGVSLVAGLAYMDEKRRPVAALNQLSMRLGPISYLFIDLNITKAA